MKHEQQLAVKQETAMTLGDRMAESGIKASDLAIPRLQLMQPTSEMVGSDEAKTGDIINTGTNEVIGGVDRPIDIIPMSLYKTIVTEDMSQKPPKFLRQEAATTTNERLPWEDVENGVPIKRTHCMNFFCLLSSEVVEDNAFPVVVRFKSTSAQAGRQLATHLFKRMALNQTPYSQAISLGVRKDKKDTNTYAVFTIGKARAATEKELEAAQLYSPTLGELKAKVDAIQEANESEAVVVPATVAGTPEAGVSF